MLNVAGARERHRRRRLRRIAVVLGMVTAWMWIRFLRGNPVEFGLPTLSGDLLIWLPAMLIIGVLALVMIGPMLGNARSPHVLYMPEQIEVGFSNVLGLGAVLAEVRHTLQVFLDQRKFSEHMGGSPRRGVLFEGPPGTGKTLVAKAMAKEAGVPFLFVSSTAFQSMWYGMTGRRIKSYFRALRKTARREGGAIGFIEEIDAIGVKRGGMNGFAGKGSPGREVSPTISEGVGGVVNELLIQMQSFDEPTIGNRIHNWLVDRINRFLPPNRYLKMTMPEKANVLIIGATNRADSLDPALLRPGRFDRVLHFDIPSRSGRQELIGYFLGRKAHSPDLDDMQAHHDLAASTMGYSPASLERLFDEALLMALRDGREALTIGDLRRARMEVEIGLAEPTEYPLHERETIAVHESGHATVAYLVGHDRRLEVLTIVKRRSALGLLAHSDSEERYTKSRQELVAMLQIALGGMVAEELFFGESGTGPAGDLKAATDIAVEMVGSLGMGGSLVSYRSLDRGVMGGNLASAVLGDRLGREAVDTLLSENKDHVTRLLAANRNLIEALRDALLDKEELIDEEILTVLHSAEQRSGQRRSVVVDLRESRAEAHLDKTR